MSSTRHAGPAGGSRRKKSHAEANVSTVSPSVWSKRCIARRTESSSSTTNTIASAMFILLPPSLSHLNPRVLNDTVTVGAPERQYGSCTDEEYDCYKP